MGEGVPVPRMRKVRAERERPKGRVGGENPGQSRECGEFECERIRGRGSPAGSAHVGGSG
ncbi:hypothetical protein GCM10009555_077120 [Acrocarpospora macrocephala]|uniref:Uncharacterized protein n=1 Tax=Acrocarpospora macrocephala TaxID=150177 RepID=A0A5M3X196_9ACTN|nr:hypothetical protein Amac_090820 [Acrocarpospora macrocephala]